jgi:hypothetical protein
MLALTDDLHSFIHRKTLKSGLCSRREPQIRHEVKPERQTMSNDGNSNDRNMKTTRQAVADRFCHQNIRICGSHALRTLRVSNFDIRASNFTFQRLDAGIMLVLIPVNGSCE